MDALAKKRRDDDDDDDEIMFFLLPALHLLGSTRKPRQKIPRHTSRLPRKERLEEVLNGHVKDCCVAFRMEPNIFRAIAAYLRDEHLLRDTRGVRVEEQFAFFMYMLSHNASYEDIQYEFKHREKLSKWNMRTQRNQGQDQEWMNTPSKNALVSSTVW